MTFTADRAVAESRRRSSSPATGALRGRVALALAVGLTATAVAPVLAELTVDPVPQRVAPEQPPVALLSAMMDQPAAAATSADALAQGVQQLNDHQYEEALASLQQAKPEELNDAQKAQLQTALAQATEAAGQRKTARAAFEEGERALASGDNLTAITKYSTAAHTPNADAATVDKANTQIAVALGRAGDLKQVYASAKADLDAGNLDAAATKFAALNAVGYQPGGMIDKSPADMLALIQQRQGTTPAANTAAPVADATPAAPAADANNAQPAPQQEMSPRDRQQAARAAYVAGRDAYHRGDIAGAKQQFQRSVDLGYHVGFGEVGPTKMLVEISKKEQADAARLARVQREAERDAMASADAAAVTASQTNAADASAASSAPPATMPSDSTASTSAGPDMSNTVVVADQTQSSGQSAAQPSSGNLADTAAAERVRQEQNRFQAATYVTQADQAVAGGRYPDAIDLYSRALALDPNNEAAQAGKRNAEQMSGRAVEPANNNDFLTRVQREQEAARQNISFTIQSALERARQARTDGDFAGARSALIQAQSARDSQAGIFNQQQLNNFDAAIRTETNAVNDAERVAGEQQHLQQTNEANNRILAQKKAAEEARRNTVASLVRQARQLTDQGKYADALKVIDQILAIDPRNDYAIGVRPLVSDRQSLDRQRKTNERLGESLSEVLSQAEEARVPIPDILTYTPDWPDLSASRDAVTARERGGETDQATLALLNRPLGTGSEDIKFDSAPFVDAIQFLADSTGANIFVNWPAIEAAGVDKNVPITVSRLRNVRFSKVLQIVLDSAGGGVVRLGYTIDDGVITISTQEDLAKNVSTQTFDIRDLLINIPDFDNGGFDFQQQNQSSGDPSSGQSTGNSQGLFGGNGNNQNNNDENRVDRQQLVDQITSLITDTIASDTWKVNNGFIGAIQELGGQLIVTQTPENLSSIRQLLAKLRETRAIQVNIEARFLTVQRNFLEEVGVDFDFQFNVDYNKFPQTGTDVGTVANPTSDFSPVLVRNNFISNGTDGTPLGFTAPGQLVTGVASNLANSSSNFGLNTGVSAFLDDFRASLFLRAVQLGQNVTTLTAPRLTLFNGQQAYITVVTRQAYVSGLIPVVSAGSIGYRPTIGQADTGVNLQVQATVSADRKYVTMTVRPQLSRLLALRNFTFSTQQTNLNNVTGSGGVQTALQTIQVPETEQTELRTTVSVPDRGTLLLGGQTLVGEIERESGVPVLSKIPFLKRLFTNRGTAKDEQVLLILIKPTIIIQREVEQNTFPLLEPQ